MSLTALGLRSHQVPQ